MLSLDEMIDRLMRTVTAGLRKPGGEPSSESTVHAAMANDRKLLLIWKVPVVWPGLFVEMPSKQHEEDTTLTGHPLAGH